LQASHQREYELLGCDNDRGTSHMSDRGTNVEW
jgi:hypothetical protein